MLLSNFPLDHPSEILRPLPYFEQATTLGHGILMDTSPRVFGPEGMGRIHTMRTFSVLCFSAALLWQYFLLRRWPLPIEALLSVSLIGCSPTALIFAVNTKHYSFEFAATVLLLGAALYYLKHPTFGRASIVAVAGVVVSLFAFVAPVIFAAVGIATIVAQVVETKRSQKPTPRHWLNFGITIALGVIIASIAAGFYLGYTNVVSVFDREAYAYRDAEKFIEINDLLSQQSLRNMLTYLMYVFKLTEVGFYEYETRLRLTRILLGTSALVFFFIGVISLWKRSPFW